MILVRAPVRISFGGGGTDLAAYYERHSGLVVSTSIARYCYAMATAPADGGVRISSADYHIWAACERGAVPAIGEPLALPKAAVAWFADDGLRDTGVELFLASEVPPGSGLGSSSAMAVALVRALATYVRRPLGVAEAAEIACALEIEWLGRPIGKQDQYASAFGGLNSIAFSADGVSVTPLAVSPDLVAALDARLLLFATGQTHDSAAILGRQRADSRANPAVINSLHRIKALAEEMRASLVAGDLDGFGRLLDRAWQEKKSLSGGVSTAAIDCCYAAARAAGALGGKITGAGGGGFLLLYCPPPCQPDVRAALAGLGLREMPFQLTDRGAEIVASGSWVSKPLGIWEPGPRSAATSSNVDTQQPSYPAAQQPE